MAWLLGRFPALSTAFAAWKIVALAIVLLPTVFLLGQCRGEGIGKDRAEKAAHKAAAKLERKAAASDLKSAERRGTDTQTIEQASKERTDAISQAPDAKPAAPDLALSCARRVREYRTTGRCVPVTCGLHPPAKACPAR